MANETVQWVLLFILTILMLGVLRQIGVWLPQERRSTSGSGPAIGNRLPKRALVAIETAVAGGIEDKEILVAFVVENCAGCQRLLANLNGHKGGETLVILAKDPSPPFRDALIELGVPTVFDDGTLWRACRISATPLVVRINEQGRVLGKEVTHRVRSAALQTAS